jgi:ribosomal small subunit protein bTHX
MGKGDKKSEKGKRFRHSFGKTRLRKKGKVLISRKKVEEKPKPAEHKKLLKTEPEFVKPSLPETIIEKIVFKESEIVEVKEEVKPIKIQEPTTVELPITMAEPVVTEEKQKEEPKEKETQKKEEPIKEAPKKRGRPKKKKEE